MAYKRIVWKNRIVERPQTYEVTENDDGTITLTPVTGEVLQQGTPVSDKNLNYTEDGIQKTSVALDWLINIVLSFVRSMITSINGKKGGDITLTAKDVKARPDNWMPSAADVGALPSTYTPPVTSVNGATGIVNVSMIKTNNGYATLYYNANAGCYLVSVDQTSDSGERKSGFYVDFVTKKSVAYYQEDGNPKYDVLYSRTANPPKIGVTGAQEGHVAVFNANGDIVSSGKSFWDFTRAKMTLSGTTLTITTVS